MCERVHVCSSHAGVADPRYMDPRGEIWVPFLRRYPGSALGHGAHK